MSIYSLLSDQLIVKIKRKRLRGQRDKEAVKDKMKRARILSIQRDLFYLLGGFSLTRNTWRESLAWIPTAGQ